MAVDLIARELPAAPRSPAGCAPLRRPRSVRRTSSIDVTWPQGAGAPMQFDGHARDIFTAEAGGRPALLRGDVLWAQLDPDRTIRAIAAEPSRSGIEQLIGCKGGGYLRQEIDAALPAERQGGTPLYQLLDDISGTSLIARWALSHWQEQWLADDHSDLTPEQLLAARRARMENVCTGFRTGSSAMSAQQVSEHSDSSVVPLPNPADPEGWHSLPSASGPSLRRARRIDVWLDGVIHVDAMFQDSATVPAGGRLAIHEYTLRATADPTTLELLEVVPAPRILPWPECPSAVANVARLHGTPLRELRDAVLQALKRELGCTHLNDALRALAEVPLLVEDLQRSAISPRS